MRRVMKKLLIAMGLAAGLWLFGWLVDFNIFQ
jgi:hypothetical protein